MQASFILIYDDSLETKMPTNLVRGFFATLGYQINHINILDSDFLEQDLIELIEDKSVIITPFCDEECLQKIKNVLCEQICPEIYQKCEFGYMATNAEKTCFIINRELDENIYPALLKESMNARSVVQQGANYKLFGYDLENVVKIAQGISNIFGTNFAYNYDCGDMLLHFDDDNSQNQKNVEQALYNSFGDRIYVDDNISLLSALTDIMAVQKRRLLILDYAGCDFLKNGLVKLCEQGLVEFLEKREFKSLDKARQYILDKKFDLLAVISKINDNLVLALIDEIKSQNVQISLNNLQKYGTTGVLYRILYILMEKFRKTPWQF